MNTKLLLTLVGLLATSITLSAQSSVWKITKDKRTVYIGGVCQMIRAADFPLPKEFDQAFTGSAHLVLETDVSALQSPVTQKLLATRASASDGKTLDKVLAPASWKNIQEFCANAGIPEDNMNAVRAWRCRAMLTSVELQKAGATTKGIPAHFYQRTIGTNKSVGFLSTLDQYIDQLAREGSGRESELIDYTLKEVSGYAAKQEAVVNAWKTGDMAKVDELLLKEARQTNPAIYNELVTQRHAAWMPSIEALFQNAKVEFMLVNVRHLAGPDGLLSQLGKRGYTVEQLKAPAAKS